MPPQSAGENVELVRRFYERARAYRAGRWDHLEMLSQAVVFRPIDEWPDAGERRGRAQFREFMTSFWSGDAWEEISYAATRHVGIGDKVITRIELRGLGRGSAAQTHARVFTVATLDAGRIVRLEDFTDRDAALAAAWRTTAPSPGVEMVRRSLELINAEGAEAAALLAWTWHPEIRWTPSVRSAETQVHVGHDGMGRYLDRLFAGFCELKFEDVDCGEVDDRVLALYTLRARADAGSPQVVRPRAALWRLADGKLAEGHGYRSHEEALVAAGLLAPQRDSTSGRETFARRAP